MGGLPLYTVDGIGQFGVPSNLPSIQYQNTYQVSTTFSKLSGNHSWKWGFQFSRPMTGVLPAGRAARKIRLLRGIHGRAHHDRRRNGHGPDAANPIARDSTSASRSST